MEEVWNHKGMLVFKFAGVDSMDAAEPLRGAEVRIPPSERVALEPGEYFQSDMVGCEVRDRASDASSAGSPAGRNVAGPPCSRSMAAAFCSVREGDLREYPAGREADRNWICRKVWRTL